MAKKHKDVPKNGNPRDDSKSEGSSNHPALFKTLFGEIPDQVATSNALFSDSNPFRRKPLETRVSNDGPGIGFVEKDPEAEGNSRNSDVSGMQQERKRKKDKSKKYSPDVDGESVGQKGKKLRSAELEGDEKDEMEHSGAPTVEPGNPVAKSEQKKKKKRKRDEIEAEYEAKRYGETDDMEENKRDGHVLGEKRKNMDNPEDMMLSKEGFDDESKLLRTIFVGNLPLKLKKKEIAKEFGKFGEVESVRIRSVPIVDGKIPRKGAVIKKQFNENGDSVHAYIVFKTEESAQASLTHNMAVVGGNHIRVDRACPPRKKLKGHSTPLYDNKRTVFVGNLPFDVKDEELYKLFTSIKNLENSIEAVRVIRDPGSSLGKGIAYVLFKTKDAANLIAKRRNLRIRDRELRLSVTKPQPETPLKRKNSSPDNSSAKRFARTPDSSNTVKPKANLSYQGLRATKSGTPKKTHTNKYSQKDPYKPKPKSKAGTDSKSRKNKRPAVAARKEKSLRAVNAPPQSGGKKRKFSNRTPQTGGQNKKLRKF